MHPLLIFWSINIFGGSTEFFGVKNTQGFL